MTHIPRKVGTSLLFEHDLFGKPVSTHRVAARGHAFPDHAREDRGKGYIAGQGHGPSQRDQMMTSTEAADDAPLRPGPFRSSVMQIEPQWIDYNGHLNMAYYNVMFDRAIDELWLKLGIGPAYMKARHASTFTAECHVRYLREIHLGDPVQISIILAGADEKRLHTFEELRHAVEGWLSATSENMTIHIDMTARKTAPFPPDIRARIAAVANAHAAIPRPEGMGRKIAMPSK
jgi:acyl-CoA thioester hydrolase